jgi:hypothetical protein
MVASLLAAGSASAATLDFSGNICDPGGNAACVNYAYIAQGYGDIPGQLDVVYDRDIGGTGEDRLSWWDTSYSELFAVAWGGLNDASGRPEIFFDPAPGYEVTVSSFRLGAWPNTSRTTQVSVLDGSGDELFASAPGITISGAASSLFSGPWTSAEGIRIQWGPSGYNVGIDDIVFAVRPSGVAPVPLPAPLALLATGLVALAGLHRARRSA